MEETTAAAAWANTGGPVVSCPCARGRGRPGARGRGGAGGGADCCARGGVGPILWGDRLGRGASAEVMRGRCSVRHVQGGAARADDGSSPGPAGFPSAQQSAEGSDLARRTLRRVRLAAKRKVADTEPPGAAAHPVGATASTGGESFSLGHPAPIPGPVKDGGSESGERRLQFKAQSRRKSENQETVQLEKNVRQRLLRIILSYP